MSLTKERCVACRADSPKVTGEELPGLRASVSEWNITEEDGTPHLERTFKTADFAGAMALGAAVGRAADEEDHHPRITVEWGRVNVAWWTHKIRGLHRNDFIMAAKTDEIFENLQ